MHSILTVSLIIPVFVCGFTYIIYVIRAFSCAY